MDEELSLVLNNILFQLHVITSQNYTAMAMAQGEDPVSEKTREYGMRGLEQEKIWMNGFLENRGLNTCASGNGSSSDS